LEGSSTIGSAGFCSGGFGASGTGAAGASTIGVGSAGAGSTGFGVPAQEKIRIESVTQNDNNLSPLDFIGSSSIFIQNAKITNTFK